MSLSEYVPPNPEEWKYPKKLGPHLITTSKNLFPLLKNLDTTVGKNVVDIYKGLDSTVTTHTIKSYNY